MQKPGVIPIIVLCYNRWCSHCDLGSQLTFHKRNSKRVCMASKAVLLSTTVWLRRCLWAIWGECKLGSLGLKAPPRTRLSSSQLTRLAFSQQLLEWLHLLFRPVSVLIGWYPCCTNYLILSVSSLAHLSALPRSSQQIHAEREPCCAQRTVQGS